MNETQLKLNNTYARYKAELAEIERNVIKKKAQIQAMLDAGADSDREDVNSDTLTNAVFSTVKAFPHSVSVSEVHAALAKSGFRQKGANHKITLYKTLLRLVKQSRISGIQRNGIWYFTSP